MLRNAGNKTDVIKLLCEYHVVFGVLLCSGTDGLHMAITAERSRVILRPEGSTPKANNTTSERRERSHSPDRAQLAQASLGRLVSRPPSAHRRRHTRLRLEFVSPLGGVNRRDQGRCVLVFLRSPAAEDTGARRRMRRCAPGALPLSDGRCVLNTLCAAVVSRIMGAT